MARQLGIGNFFQHGPNDPVAQRFNVGGPLLGFRRSQAECLCQTHDVGHIVRTGTQTSFLPAAGLLGQDRHPLADVKHPDPLRSVEFVRAERKQVNAQMVHIQVEIRACLDRIRMEGNPGGVTQPGDFRDRVDRTDLVVGIHHRGDRRLAAQGASHAFGTDAPGLVDRQPLDLETMPGSQLFRRPADRGMLAAVGHDPFHLPHSAPRKCRATQGQVVRLRTAGGENDLLRQAVQDLRHGLARRLNGSLGFLSVTVDGRGVAKILIEVGQHRRHHAPVDRGRGGVIKVNFIHNNAIIIHLMFLPTTLDELGPLGWDGLDVILVTGDSYIDSPFIGTAVIGKVLLNAGFRVGIIAQPDPKTDADIGRLGEPRLFWGVTAGSVDSMVANYTALKKPRRSDDYTPGGQNTRRPDRATIVYANIIRRFSKKLHPGQPTRPIVLGGIEASLRRVAHYDFWDDAVRRSVLFDAKADYILYGMAENPVLEFAAALRDGEDPRRVRGLCYIAREAPEGYLELPAYETVAADKKAFIAMFHAFYRNNDPVSARGLVQKHADRFLVQNPPAAHQTQAELDAVYALGFERLQHPYYEAQGQVKALDTIGFSISTHRGCYGECSFCAIAVHEGTTVRWRSPASILDEAEGLTRHPGFKGYISDLGGPTANMYGFECRKKLTSGICTDKRCVYPGICPVMKVDHQPQIDLLRKVRKLPGVKKVFVASGLRYDMILSDQACGDAYLREIVEHHVSGQLKIAPEHTEAHVLDAMGKPGPGPLLDFKRKFDNLTRQAGKPQFLTYYMIAAHPGCTAQDMLRLKKFSSEKLHISPEQVQIFTPTPSTYASLMYYTELDPFSMRHIFVEKDPRRKEHQKNIVTRKPPVEFS
jgi:uncharacterized radical SAM protein YgiQ